MNETVKNVLKAVGTMAVITLLAIVFVGAGAYNQSQIDGCKDRGLTWVKEAPYGSYGCAKMEK